MFTPGELIVVLWHIPMLLFIFIPLALLILWSFGLLYYDIIKQFEKSVNQNSMKEEKPVIINLITHKAV